MWSTVSWALPLVLLPFSVCNGQAVTLVEPAISDPVKRDIGISGSWRYSLSLKDRRERAAFKDEVPLPIIKIAGPDPKGVYTFHVAENEHLTGTAKATHLSDDVAYFITEIELTFTPRQEKPSRCLAVTKIEKDSIHVWWVESKNLAKHLFAENVSAVIEHGFLRHEVWVKPEGLLKTIRLHSKDLVGTPETLRRVKQDEP